MAVHLRDGVEHPVFIPNSGYSGSLKAHLTVPLSLLVDMPRAFALASVLFYALFVAGRLSPGAAAPTPGGERGLLAGLYAAFAPAWVTHYSLSNDGNYVEVLALGSLGPLSRGALDRGGRAQALCGPRPSGLLLGLAFWCHILAVIHVARRRGLVLIASGRRAPLRSLPRLAGGLARGLPPGAALERGERLVLLRLPDDGRPPGQAASTATAFSSRILPMVTDHWPILLGYDSWYPPLFDAAVARSRVARRRRRRRCRRGLGAARRARGQPRAPAPFSWSSRR